MPHRSDPLQLPEIGEGLDVSGVISDPAEAEDPLSAPGSPQTSRLRKFGNKLKLRR